MELRRENCILFSFSCLQFALPVVDSLARHKNRLKRRVVISKSALKP